MEADLSIQKPLPKPARDPRHRRLDRSTIIEMLAVESWSVDLQAGRLDVARQGASQALDIALAAGVGFAEPTPGQRLFDFVEIQDVLSWTVASGFDSYWNASVAASNVALAGETRGFAAAAGGGASTVRVRLRLCRTFDLRRFETGAAVRLRMPLPLRSEYHPSVDVAPRIAPGLGAAVMISDGRLEARLAVPADTVVSIGAEVDLIAGLPAPAANAGELDRRERDVCLRPTEGFIQVSDGVRRLADQLAGDRAPVAAVAAFSKFLIEAFEFRTMRYEELDGESACDWALRERGYDCVVCAALLAALCRARGIPARVVGGHYLSRSAPTNHGWTEIWIDHLGWAPIDLYHRDRYRPVLADPLDWPTDFLRRRDFRLLMERKPLFFTGPMSVRFPGAWQMLFTAADGGGLDITYVDIADGSLIWRDRIVVDPIG